MNIMLLSFVVSPVYVHLPNLSFPCIAILLLVVLAMICRHPPGLYAVGNFTVLVAVIVLEFGRCDLIFPCWSGCLLQIVVLVSWPCHGPQVVVQSGLGVCISI